MEYSLCELKKKQVINTCNGKKLGKINDTLISFPSGKIITASPASNFLFAASIASRPFPNFKGNTLKYFSKCLIIGI